VHVNKWHIFAEKKENKLHNNVLKVKLLFSPLQKNPKNPNTNKNGWVHVV
jgi:hypothetical protein